MMNLKFKLALIFCLGLSISYGQVSKKKDRVPSYFGFQAKPLFPGFLIGTTSFDVNRNGFNNTISQKVGYSYGAVVRVGLTKLIALETGINFSQRAFEFQSSVPDSNFYTAGRIRYVTYDIPISALFYIPISNEWFLNASVGVALSYNPSAAGVRTNPYGYHTVSQLAIGRKVVGEALANFGIEYRTKKAGTFYLGVLARVPFAPLFYMRSTYSYQGFVLQTDAENFGKIDGSYLSAEVKYFFPLIKSKGSPIKTPIE